jgi:hypothetical protein
MQARLQPSEFAYLLQSLGASKVIGANNSQLFPQEDHMLDSLLQQGFSALEEHGWLVPDERGYKTNTGLVLLTAVIANPEFAVFLTLAAPDGGKQFVTYYLAQNIIVEQIFTSERHYLLTQLDKFDMIVERLGKALSIGAKVHPWADAISVESNAFENAMQQVTNDNLMALEAVLRTSNDEISNVSSLARIMKTLRPVGRVECANLSGDQLKVWYDIFFYQDVDSHIWAMTKNVQLDSLVFHPLNWAAFETLLSRIISTD